MEYPSKELEDYFIDAISDEKEPLISRISQMYITNDSDCNNDANIQPRRKEYECNQCDKIFTLNRL